LDPAQLKARMHATFSKLPRGDYKAAGHLPQLTSLIVA